MTTRKPCFECNDDDQDNMGIGECYESDLCTAKGGPCWYMKRGGHWEDCSSGARSEEFPAWRYKQNMTQCPCCKGSGFIPKEWSIPRRHPAEAQMTPFFRCAECGDHVKATEYGECAYCGGDVEIIDGEAQMIDIDHLERRIKYRDEGEPLLPPSPEEVLALIAEIKRLRKRCPKCGNDVAVHMGSIGKRPVFWIECAPCGIASDAGLTEADAWVSWSGEI